MMLFATFMIIYTFFALVGRAEGLLASLIDLLKTRLSQEQDNTFFTSIMYRLYLLLIVLYDIFRHALSITRLCHTLIESVKHQ